jgi:hypothetical protein
MPEAKTYEGSCHCGNVRYRVESDLGHVVSCNCSICRRKGTLLTFVPAAKFELVSGEEALSDYQFNRMNVHHLFCSTCGIASFSRGTGPDGQPMAAINVRCLDGVDLDALTITPFDGASI